MAQNTRICATKNFMKNDNITKNIAFAVENELIDEKINDLIKLCNLNTFVENKEKK